MNSNDELIERQLKKIEIDLDHINKQLQRISNIMSQLGACVETYANGKAYFHITDD